MLETCSKINNGKINTRAAKEGTMKELNKSIVHLLTHQAKQRKAKRKRDFKKLERKSRIHELERIVQSYDMPQRDTSRNFNHTDFTLPLLNVEKTDSGNLLRRIFYYFYR